MTPSSSPGSWPSPLSAGLLAKASPRISGARFSRGAVLWGESIAAERGRVAIFREHEGERRLLLPAPWSARSRVHEYGGGAWDVAAGSVVFVEATDQRVYLFPEGSAPRPLSPAVDGTRYGDLTVSAAGVLAVREFVAPEGGAVERALVALPLDGSLRERVLVTGADFFAFPRLSPDGTHLAWMEWDHPAMPWDATRICISPLDDPEARTVVAGGPGVSAMQPEWTSEGYLLFTSDEATPATAAFRDPRRWNLHRATIRNGRVSDTRPLAPADADTGGPLWGLGSRWFAPLPDGRIIAVRTNGSDEIVVIDGDRVASLDTPLSAEVQIADVHGTRVLLTGAGRTTTQSLIELDLATEKARVITGGALPVDASYLSPAEPLVFDGPRGPVHAFHYPPQHPERRLLEGERAPYLLLVHGGPTGHESGAAAASIAYFTSRGIGVLDVNYGGSTGYGRGYRERLAGAWGVADVEDVIAAARGIAQAGLADPERIAIKGGSAGGWTVLCALAASDVFGAGISRYGVADLRALVAETHDFESRYLDGLVGPYPEAADLYAERSPLSRPDALTTPMLILQGADDPVVPPSQAEAIVAALKAQGVPHRYVLYPGEAHGFRQAATIVDAFESELRFLGETFGFAPAL